MKFNASNRFDDPVHEALMSVWWSGILLKREARRFFRDRIVSEPQFNVMMLLKYAEGPLSQQDLSERLLVDKSNLTGLVGSLENLGFVKRRKSPDDRRFYRLTLTAQGSAFLDVAESPYRELVYRIMSVYSPSEMKQLTELMLRLQSGLEEEK